MGVDTLNKRKGTLKKARDKQNAKLSTELIADVVETHIVVVEPSPGYRFTRDTHYELHLSSGGLEIYLQRKLVGKLAIESPALTEKIRTKGGKALGELNRIRQITGQVELKVKIQ